MTKGAAIFLAAAGLALAACGKSATDEGNAMSLLPPCGAAEYNPTGGWSRFAAVDEGGGKVGLAYDNTGDQVVAGLPRGYYRLHDCRTGSATGFDADGRPGLPAIEAFLIKARQDGLMSSPQTLVNRAAQAGFLQASNARWNAEEMAEYAACGCGQFYPGLGGSRGGQGQ